MVLFNNLLSRWSDYYVTSPYNINTHIAQRTRDQNGKIDQPEAFIFIYTGAPNENIAQNHLNIELLNVFQYLNGRYRHIFSPKKFSSVRIS